MPITDACFLRFYLCFADRKIVLLNGKAYNYSTGDWKYKSGSVDSFKLSWKGNHYKHRAYCWSPLRMHALSGFTPILPTDKCCVWMVRQNIISRTTKSRNVCVYSVKIFPTEGKPLYTFGLPSGCMFFEASHSLCRRRKCCVWMARRNVIQWAAKNE